MERGGKRSAIDSMILINLLKKLIKIQLAMIIPIKSSKYLPKPLTDQIPKSFP